VLRRALRRLRYAEEWLDADTKDLHEFLDVLGDLNNRVVEAHHLAECRSSHALEHAVAVEQKITDKRDEAALGWKTLRKKLEERE
jgi:hypothetical protein